MLPTDSLVNDLETINSNFSLTRRPLDQSIRSKRLSNVTIDLSYDSKSTMVEGMMINFVEKIEVVETDEEGETEETRYDDESDLVDQALISSTQYLKETPSLEPFNFDQDLVNILRKNQSIIRNSEPLFVLHPPIRKEQDLNLIQSTNSLIHIIRFCKLYRFRRFPRSETLYSQEYSKVVKLKYGSSSNYLKSRLKFDPQVKDLKSLMRFDSSGSVIKYFSSDSALQDGNDYRVVTNEWPYALPRDYQHLVVWSRLPLLNPNLCNSRTEMNLALDRGLSGFINLSRDLRSKLEYFKLSFKEQKMMRNGCEVSVDEEEAEFGLEQEIVKFIKKRWRIEEGYFDLMWILNPIQLQSCPTLPHFHVFVKKPIHL